jgi:hypothetical protein
MTARAADPAPAESAPPAKVDAALEGKFESRTAAVLKVLALPDPAAAKRVHDAILAHYEAINAWHAANDGAVASLKKPAPGASKPSDEAQAEIATRNAALAELHSAFLGALAKDLTPAQVEQVKDELTYNTVKFTYDNYLKFFPTLTDADKAVVLGYLKEAREQAIDGGSQPQKVAIFKVYKGRIQNFLSKHGYKSNQEGKSQPAAKPAPEPAAPANPS